MDNLFPKGRNIEIVFEATVAVSKNYCCYERYKNEYIHRGYKLVIHSNIRLISVAQIRENLKRGHAEKRGAFAIGKSGSSRENEDLIFESINPVTFASFSRGWFERRSFIIY